MLFSTKMRSTLLILDRGGKRIGMTMVSRDLCSATQVKHTRDFLSLRLTCPGEARTSAI